MALSFDEMDEDFKASVFYNTIDSIGNIFFFMDILLQMNTTYYDRDGEEIYNKKKIRIHYIFGMFLVDLLSSLPIELACPVGIYIILFSNLDYDFNSHFHRTQDYSTSWRLSEWEGWQRSLTRWTLMKKSSL